MCVVSRLDTCFKSLFLWILLHLENQTMKVGPPTPAHEPSDQMAVCFYGSKAQSGVHPFYCTSDFANQSAVLLKSCNLLDPINVPRDRMEANVPQTVV